MTTNASRRHFLKTCSALSMAGAAGPFALNLAAIGAASAQTAPAYRAIVCLFFYGGNDHTNTFIPYDPTSPADGIAYDSYLAARDTIAIPYAQLANTRTGAVTSQGGHEFAFHPALTAFKTHWDAGKLAVLANVGPLIVPTTRAQYQQSSHPKPPKLFSHNDQQSVWQAYQPIGEGAKVGWGGRIGDLLMSQNSNTLYTCISAGGNSVFLPGINALQYQVGSSGPVRISAIPPTTNLFGSTTAPAAYETLVKSASPNLFENELGVVTNRSITANQQLSAALPVESTFPITTASGLASQLRIIARIIAARTTLGSTRQVFLVSIGGFDNHDVLLTQHAQQLAQVNSAVNDFYNWLALPVMGGTPGIGVQNDVTLFTASDFGRTLTSNGDGSDHGWGSHHFVLGGAVQGGNVYGTFPPTTFFANGNTVDIGQGNLVPTLAVDQYAGTLARWMGVTNLSDVLPNNGNFSPNYLPFLP